MGVMPMRGLPEPLQTLFAERSSSARRVRADRSFACAFGMPIAARRSCASLIRSSLVTIGRFDNCVDLPLRHRLPIGGPFPEADEGLFVRVLHGAQVCRVHLRMPAEIPEVLIDYSRIQEDRHSASDVLLYASLSSV